PHEVIVVNDGADAATEQVVRDVYPTFRVINIPQCGAAEARNVGARLAANDALLFLDDDDTLRHDAVEVLTTNLTAFPEAGASFGDHTFTDLVTGEHRPNHFAFLPHYERFRKVKPIRMTSDAALYGRALYRQLLYGNLLGQPWAVWRRVYNALGGF